jgi:[protein-PII] uridylyltransferase
MSVSVADAAADTSSLKSDYKAAKAQLVERFKTAPNVDTLMRALARTTDGTLRRAWDACELPASLALVAVGGFGRGELAPYSDIDILVLLPDDEPLAPLEARIERFIGLSWDLGLEIGSSVRTVSQCLEEAANDVTVRTSLLEARRLTGSAKLYGDFAQRYRDALDPRAFFQAKVLEMRQRHARFQDTPYSLEPNLKESPGGLRDLQLILWITEAAALGSSWRELDQRGLITNREARERAIDAPLLLGRQGGHAVVDDPDPEHRGATVSQHERRHARAVRSFRRKAGNDRDRQRRRVRARAACDPRSVPAV